MNENDWLDKVRADTATAATEYPEHTWLVNQPDPNDIPAVIDREGIAWVWGPSPEDPDEYAYEWVRQAWTLIGDGKYLTGPSLCPEWVDDVLQFAPIRAATPEDDLSTRYRYYPDGWKDGGPRGEVVVLSHSEYVNLVISKMAAS